MTRIMRDSTVATDIPIAGTQLAAGYINGSFQNIEAMRARFAHIPVVSIDVFGSDNLADVLDVENFDATPAESYVWLKAKIARGDPFPTVYCNRSTQPLVEVATKELIHGRDYWFWIATLDGTVILPDMTGVVAVQDKGATTGNHYDESVVYDNAWHPSSVPASQYVVVHLPDGNVTHTSSGFVLP